MEKYDLISILYPQWDHFLPCGGFLLYWISPRLHIFNTNTERWHQLQNKLLQNDLLKAKPKRQPSLASMPITSVGTVWKFSASWDLQGLNCQMLLIDIRGISLMIYYRISLAWIGQNAGWLRGSHCHNTMCCQTVIIFHIQSRRIDHKHGKISDCQTKETLV